MNQRGTVVKVRLDPTLGREQAGVRPALVVSSTFFNERSDLLIVLPITSKKVDRIYPFEIALDPLACGLDAPSKAMANQVRTIDKQRVIGTYGIVSSDTLAAVDEALALTLGLTDIEG